MNFKQKNKLISKMVAIEKVTQNGFDTEIKDPSCLAEKPVRVTFQDIASAAFMIRSGVEYTPCTVNMSVRELHTESNNRKLF